MWVTIRVLGKWRVELVGFLDSDTFADPKECRDRKQEPTLNP